MEVPAAILSMENSCEDVSRILKSMAHPRRLMILGHLSSGDKTVTELVDLCGISQSQMSHFLARMNIEGLVKSDRDGKFKIYTIADKRLKKVLNVIQKEFCG